jgi:putative nucleotidyltransferase with HDIG domain
MDFIKAKDAFENYVRSYDLKDKNINLKYHHTYKVVELMAELAFRLGLSKEDIELAKLIGLLHDIGRFEQLKEYDSFSDKNMDHADFGCHYLFQDYHIRDYGIDEDTETAKIIEKAIRNHNKLEIEEGLNEKELLFAKMIRDMDKVDIFRVLAIEFKNEFTANEVSKEVLEEFSLKKSIPNKLVKSKSDGTLVKLSFLFDINFNESYDILVENDNFDLYLSTVEVSEDSEKLWKKVREISFDQINKGIGD